MTAALATLAFLTTLWMIVVVGAMVLEASGDKILAALKGRPVTSKAQSVAVRARHAPRVVRPLRATPRQRAAA